MGVSSFGFFEVLLNARDAEPQSVLRAVHEGEAFVKHHAGLVAFVEKLLLAAQRETERSLSIFQFQDSDAMTSTSTMVGEESVVSSTEQQPTESSGRPLPAPASASPPHQRKVSITTPESYRRPPGTESLLLPENSNSDGSLPRSTTQIRRNGPLSPMKPSCSSDESFDAALAVTDAPAHPGLDRQESSQSLGGDSLAAYNVAEKYRKQSVGAEPSWRLRRGSAESFVSASSRHSLVSVHDAPAAFLTKGIAKLNPDGSKSDYYVDAKAREMVRRECRGRSRELRSNRVSPEQPRSPRSPEFLAEQREENLTGSKLTELNQGSCRTFSDEPKRAKQRKVLTLNGGNVDEWAGRRNSDMGATLEDLEHLQLRPDQQNSWDRLWARVPLISYHSKFVLYWQIAMVLTICYVSISVPVAIAWGQTLLPGSRCVRWMYHVDLFVDTFFLADITLTFATTYLDEITGEEVKDRRCIAYRYMFDPREGKWIAFDAIASLPTSFFGCVNDTAGFEYIRFIRFSKLFKMLRMLRINSIIDTRHLPFFHPVMMRFMRILLALLFVWHLFACLYWRVARLQAPCEKDELGCWPPPPNVMSAAFFRQYSYAYLWGTIHSFGSLYVVPSTTSQLWTTTVVAVVGLITNAIVIGSATNVLDGFASIAKTHQKRKDSVNHFMRWQHFPAEYIRRVNDFLDYQWSTGAAVDVSEVMKDLPPPLQLEMRMCLNRKIIDTQPLFWELGPRLMMVLVTALEATITTPSETLIREGDKGETLFFLVHGECLAYCQGRPGDFERARDSLKAKQSAELAARVMKRRLVARRGSVFAGQDLTHEADKLQRVLKRDRRDSTTARRSVHRELANQKPRANKMMQFMDRLKFKLAGKDFIDSTLLKVGMSRPELHHDHDDDEDRGDSDGSADADYVEKMSEHVVLLNVLKIGAVIGEIALLSEDGKRTASVITTQHCELYSLHDESFNYICEHASEWHKILISSAEQRMAWSNEMKALVAGDVIETGIEDPSAFLAKRRTTASRIIGPFQRSDQVIKRDNQSHWDYMVQQKVVPKLEAVRGSGRKIIQTAQGSSYRASDRLKRVSKDAKKMLRLSSNKKLPRNDVGNDPLQGPQDVQG